MSDTGEQPDSILVALTPVCVFEDDADDFVAMVRAECARRRVEIGSMQCVQVALDVIPAEGMSETIYNNLVHDCIRELCAGFDDVPAVKFGRSALHAYRMAAQGAITDRLARKLKNPADAVDGEMSDPVMLVMSAMQYAQNAVSGDKTAAKAALGPARNAAMRLALRAALGEGSAKYAQATELIETGFVDEVLDFAKGRAPMSERLHGMASHAAVALVDSGCCGLFTPSRGGTRRAPTAAAAADAVL